MKAYTDLEQSKKLAEILPIESADMHYEDDISVELGHGWHPQHTSCWSLAALLDVLKYPALSQNTSNKWLISEWTGDYPKTKWEFDNPVDACYEIIILLHEQKLL